MLNFQGTVYIRNRITYSLPFKGGSILLVNPGSVLSINQQLSSKVFIEFVALIVRNRIYNLLKETMLKIESSPNYMTVPAALRELEKIEMIRRNNGSYALDHAVTKKQKIILSAFGLNEDSIRTGAAEISSLLASNQPLMNKSKEVLATS